MIIKLFFLDKKHKSDLKHPNIVKYDNSSDFYTFIVSQLHIVELNREFHDIFEALSFNNKFLGEIHKMHKMKSLFWIENPL